MDHAIIPRPCKNCDWLLNSSWDHFRLHQGKNVRVTMKFEVPKRHSLRPTLSIDMVQRVLRWDRQKWWSIRKRQGAHGGEIPSFFQRIFNEIFLGEENMKTREDKRIKLDSLSKTTLFRYLINKITFIFGCMGIPLGPHLVYT